MKNFKPKALLSLFKLRHDYLCRDGISKLYRDSLQSQYFDRGKLEKLQEQKLRALMIESVKNVPYYRDMLSTCECSIEEFQLKDLQRLPILTKDILRSKRSALINHAISPNRVVKNSTSGSTGSATYFLSDTNEVPQKIALNMRQNKWMGVEHFDRQLWIWGASFTKKTGIFKQILTRLKGKMLISSYHLSDNDIVKIKAKYESFKPNLVGAYPSHLYSFAKRSITLKHRPKAISLSGEMLFDFQREKIEEFFHAPVFNYYGARDGSMIAMECEKHDGLHLFAEHVIVEILDEENQPISSGTGKVVVTLLNNFVMPLIRYEIGDYAEISEKMWEPCACGRTLPRLDRIVGRSFDLVTFANGNKVGGTFWTLLFRSVPGIKNFYVHQDLMGRIRIEYVVDGATIPDIKAIESKIQHHAGGLADISFARVTSLSNRTKNGKLRFVISEYQK